MSDVRYRLLKDLILPPISGTRPSGGVSTDTEGVPSIGGENIDSKGGMNYGVLKQIPYRFYSLMPKGKLQVDDVLINKDGAQTGKVGLYDGRFSEAAINEHVFILRARDQEELDQHYLYYSVLLPETKVKIERRITGSAQPGLNSQFVKAVDIPFHKPALQKRIARILTTTDQAIEKTEALIEKYQQIKAGLMHDLFTRGIGADGQLRPPREQAPKMYHETPVGWIPVEWSALPLEEKLKSAPKNGYSPREVDDWQGLYVLGLSCLTKNGFKPIQLKNAPNSAILSGAIIQEGDFLISRANTPELVGLCGIYKDIGDDAIYPDLMMKLNLQNDLNSEYLEHYLLMPATRIRLTALAVGTSKSMSKLNATSVKRFKIAFPEPDEQRVLVEKIKPIHSQIVTLESQLHKLKQQKSGLMHDLLTGEVEVNVDEPEAASV